MLPNDFNQQFSQLIASFLWDQWKKLGIAVWDSKNNGLSWLIDPEALILASSSLQGEDPHLFHVMQKWMGTYHRLLHTARIRRLWKQYLSLAKKMKIPVYGYIDVQSWISKRDSFREKEILSVPRWEDSSLLWLKLRSLLGSGVRSDTLIYFLYHDIGTTFSISREMFIDQRSVHDIIRIWESVGWVRRFGQKRGYVIAPSFRDNLLKIVEIEKVPAWFNAGRVFTGMLLVKGAIERFAEHQDMYLLSSHFRDILPLLTEIWEITKVKYPNPISHPGKEYVSVFLQSIMEACEQLGRSLETSKTTRSKLESDTTEYKNTVVEKNRFIEFDLHNAAYRALRRRYPASEGWSIIPEFGSDKYRIDFVVEKRDSSGKIHRIVVEVKATCIIEREAIYQLEHYAGHLADPNVKIDGKILIVPYGARLSAALPEDVKVIYLRSFRCG